MSAPVPGLPADDNVFLTPSELATIIRVSVPTLERWRLMGGNTGPHFHKGHGKRSRVTYQVADVRAWLAKCRRDSTSDDQGR